MTSHADEVMRRAREAIDEGQGVIAPRNTFVPPAPPAPQVHLPPATTNYSTVLDVPAHAVQVVHVQTTERDRSIGYLLRSLPLYAAFGVGMVVVAVALFSYPVLSWTTFLTFWLSFVGAWLYGEKKAADTSPYAANLLEIRRKWDNIDMNDQRRWDVWEKVTGIVVSKGDAMPSWVEKYKWLIIGWIVMSVVWMLLIGLVVLLEAGQ